MKTVTTLSYVSIATGVLVLAGCSDPTAATQANLKLVVETYLQKSKACIDTTVPDSGLLPKDELPKHATKRALIKAGLVQLERRLALGGGDMVRYTFTAKAEPFLQPGRKRTQITTYSTLCFGKKELISIDQIGAPADFRGLRASRIKYTYRTILDANATWLNDPEVQQELGLKLDGTQAEMGAVLTASGWVDEITYGAIR